MTTGILTPTHLAFVLLVALLVFGPKRLPGVGRGIGEGLREFKSSISGIADDPQLSAAPATVGREHETETAQTHLPG
jgi:sec-independent protein translocase protein TatA